MNKRDDKPLVLIVDDDSTNRRVLAGYAKSMGLDAANVASAASAIAAARDAYLPHPSHQAVVALIVPLLESVAVVDYEFEG